MFLIFCPIVLTLLVELPSVQNYLIDRATSFVSQRLETRVSIDRIRLGALGSLRVDGFYVEDYQQDTMLYVGKLKVYLSRFGGGQGLTLRNGTIANAHLNIRETPSGVMNIKEVVNRIARKDRERKGRFSLKVDDVYLQDINLIVEQHEHRHPSYGIDYGDMHIEHISAFVDDFELSGGRVGGYVRNLSAVEHCGFMLQNFTGRFAVDKGEVRLTDFEIMARRSDLRLRSFVLKADTWAEYKDFINNVRITGEAYKSVVSSADVAHFAPKLLPWDMLLRDVNLTVDGTVADMMVKVENALYGAHTSIRGDVHLEGLPDVRRGKMNLDLKRLITTEPDAARLLASITGVKLPASVLTMADAAGEIICAGNFNGGFSQFDANLMLTTQTGNASFTAERRPLPRVKGEAQLSTLNANAELRHLQLGEMLQFPMLGNVSGTLAFNGTTSHNNLRGRVAGRMTDVEFNQAAYKDIDINGTVVDKSFSGSIESGAYPLSFEMSGIADLNGERPMYDLRLRVDDADLHAMNVNLRDSISHLSLDADLYASGKTLDNMNGTLTIENGRYIYNVDTLQTTPVRLVANNDDARRSLTLTSDFVDASFTGSTNYNEVLKYLQAATAKYLPGIQPTDDYKSNSDEGYSALSVTVKNIDPLLNAISSGLQLARGSTLNFVMNPSSNHLALRAESDYIERKKMLATRLNVNITNQGDSLAMYISSEDLYAGPVHLPRLSIMGGAKNNSVLLSAGFNEGNDTLSGTMALRADLKREAVTNMPHLDIHLDPATVRAAQRTWRITSDVVGVDTVRVAINNLHVASGRESLHLDGGISRSGGDTLTMSLKDFDFSPFMSFARRMGYDVEGSVNGTASFMRPSQRGMLIADLSIDSMTVNNTAVTPLHIDSQWDLESERIRVLMQNARNGDNIIEGYYAPTTMRYSAQAELPNLPMSMLDPLLVSVMSQTQGRADAKLNITGEGRHATLAGQVEVTDLSTMVDYTRTRYSVPKATVTVANNHFLANNVRVYDSEQNSGTMNLDLNLNHLSNVAYSVRVVPRNMLVLNTTSQDNDLFYGKVYASGTATISGDKSGNNMDIVATTAGASQFFMPLSSKSDATAVDYVVFEQPGVEIDSTNYLARKKMAFERRTRSSSTSSGASNMTINVDLTADRNAEVQLVIDPTVGDIIRAKGDGRLSMHIVPNANIFDMYGDYTISEGSYLFTLQNIINKRFVINSGSTIQWTGDPMDARLNIDAVYNLKASLQPLLSSTTLDNVTRAVPVECIINLTEQLTAPTVTFDIKVPNADTEIQNAVSNLLNNQQSIATQFMYLLVSGSFYSDASTSSSLGASASATTGFELLSNQLSNWLSSDDYNIILRYRPRSELTSDEIDFGFSKSLVNDRLLVELEGNYLVDNKMAQSSNMSNFMGEAYITWLIDRAGNLKLRGFTQTIDRFDENQGLQETGVGIYYKEDFDNWTDLKRRIRERFMSKRRRQQLEAEAERADSIAAAEREARAATPTQVVESAQPVQMTE
ncbi:MAG: translocation/assembly module TamB domain-containing protein [Alistipes sp.]|nr:translocation/assembly module TamB domain-containing protein [Alistipes sp.]